MWFWCLKRLLTVASIMQGFHRRLMPLFDNHHTSSLTYWHWWKHLNQGKKPCDACFGIVNDKKTLPLCRNESRSAYNVCIHTRPHPDTHSIISWRLMVSAACGPSATKHMNCLLVQFIWHHRKCSYVVLNGLVIVKKTEILTMINVVCKVRESLETPHDVFL
jgi:hypothetical protein